MSFRPSLPVHVLLAAILIGSLTATAPAKSVVPASQAVVVSTTGDALVIWDASVPINEMRVAKDSDAKLMLQIETTAGKLLIEKARKFTPAAKSVTVRVLYASTVLAELYKTATFSGFNKLISVSASRNDVVTKGDAWLKALDNNTIPSGMTVTILGKPPQELGSN